MTRLRRLLTLAVFTWLAGCAAGPALMTSPGVEPQPSQQSVAELELAQQRELEIFDQVTAGDDRCEELCAHLDAVCTIGGRICDLARQSPSDDNDAACLRARDRCDNVGARMPPECPACVER